ncbi:MAG: trypsin-like peptidase domain-containing protein [Planctomycetia bacterium]|nr:trypsin-like peptidase domain-containing protein [Planctomycetia bacterium]
MRLRRFAASLLLSLPLAVFVSAADSKPVLWNPTRTTAPESVAELKSLQDTVKGLVAKVTPATVAVILGQVDPSRSGPQSVGAGSGVIVSDDGLVLTAAHVIEPPSFGFGGLAPRRGDANPTTVMLILPGNIEVRGKILGRNPGVDSGMVKIVDPVPADATWPGAKDGKWPFVEIGDSTKLAKGQWVVSLGHPGGPKPERRAPVRLGQMVDLKNQKALVSDCTLVGGDSGGPLFDLTGKLVGIHSRIGDKIDDNVHVSTKAFQDEWKRLVRGDVIGRGESRAVLGVTLSREGKMEPVVEQLSEGSPSAKAGIKVGDRLLKLNGHVLEKTTDVDEIMTQLRPGDIATVEFRRGDEILEAKVTLGRRQRPMP